MKPNNPLLISNYHSPKFFCYRETKTETMIEALHNGRDVILIAPRRMGKIGLIRHAFYKLKENESDIVALYMGIYSTHSLGDIVCLFDNTVSGKLYSAPQKAVSRISKSIRSCCLFFTWYEFIGVPQVMIDMSPIEEESTLKEIFEYLALSEKRCYIAIVKVKEVLAGDFIRKHRLRAALH